MGQEKGNDGSIENRIKLQRRVIKKKQPKEKFVRQLETKCHSKERILKKEARKLKEIKEKKIFKRTIQYPLGQFI